MDENIKYLEEFSKTIDESINKLKEIFEIIDKNKEELKKKISEIFTRIRTALNDREDELFSEIDKIFEKHYLKEDTIKKGEKMPTKIKNYLDKGKVLNKDWNDNNKLITNLNNCINIEKDIKSIVEINESIKKCNSQSINIKLLTEEKEVDKFLKDVKIFGKIIEADLSFKCVFKESKNNKYIINNNGLNLTKNSDGWDGLILGDIEIPKNTISRWKIKINSNVRNDYDDIYIGIGKKNSKELKECWSIYSSCSQIQLKLENNSINYNNKQLKKGDVIEVIVDRISNQLSFTLNNNDLGTACSKIPKDEILFPTILLYEKNFNVEVI